MNIDDKINRIIENGKIKKRLCEIGVCGTMGPRGCKGDVGQLAHLIIIQLLTVQFYL